MNRYSKCHKCPAFHLLTEERISIIERWERKRQNNIDRIKKVKLILIGESMPASRYFYDLETEYDNGMRYNLKEEFGKLEITDSMFLESFRRKGIILFDAALCPLHRLERGNNTIRRAAATYCLLTHNTDYIESFSEVPIVTIFPSKMGWKKTEIPISIRNRVKKGFGFSNIKGLSDLYLNIKRKAK